MNSREESIVEVLSWARAVSEWAKIIDRKGYTPAFMDELIACNKRLDESIARLDGFDQKPQNPTPLRSRTHDRD